MKPALAVLARGLLGALFVMNVATGCREPETLLQLDVVMPAQKAVSFDIAVGETEHRRVKGVALPPPGQIAGIDVRLPRAMAGEQMVILVARNDQGCHVAVGSQSVTLIAGKKNGPVTVTLMDLAEPVCDANGEGPDGSVDPADAADGGEDDAGPEIDMAEPPPEPEPEPFPVDAGGDQTSGGDSRTDARPNGDVPVSDAPKPVDTPPPPPPLPRCDAAGNCAAGRNCIAGGICATATTCAQIRTQKPGAADGLYWLVSGANQQQAYCDMQLGVVLCAQTAGEHQGRTRVGPAVAFKLSGQLDVGAGTCRIWAVRHAVDGYPFDKIRPDSVSTCAALGFRSGDGGIKAGASVNRSCPYGSNPAPFSDCGYGGADHKFGGRGFYKWGNTCTSCSPAITAAGYYKQGPIFASDIHWDMSGRVSNFCNVR